MNPTLDASILIDRFGRSISLSRNAMGWFYRVKKSNSLLRDTHLEKFQITRHLLY